MGPLAMNQMTTFRWTLEEDVFRYAAAGYGAIGLWRQKLSDFGEDKAVELLAEQRLAVSSVSWAGGFTGSDGLTHEEAIEDARQAIELAAALGSPCLILHSGARGLHTQSHVRRLLREALEALLPLAEARHVALALEPMGSPCGSKWTFLNDLAGALDLVSNYRTPALKLVLDLYDWGRCETLASQLPALAPHLALVQLADGKGSRSGEPNRTLLGRGDVPLPEILAELHRLGYRGPLEIELLGEEIEACDYNRLLEGSRDYVRQALSGRPPLPLPA